MVEASAGFPLGLDGVVTQEGGPGIRAHRAGGRRNKRPALQPHAMPGVTAFHLLPSGDGVAGTIPDGLDDDRRVPDLSREKLGDLAKKLGPGNRRRN